MDRGEASFFSSASLSWMSSPQQMKGRLRMSKTKTERTGSDEFAYDGKGMRDAA
jgi:hypothetical protein